MFPAPVNMLRVSTKTQLVTLWEGWHNRRWAIKLHPLPWKELKLAGLDARGAQVPSPWVFLQGNVPAPRCWEQSLVCVWVHREHRTQRSFICACKAPLFFPCPDVNLWLRCRMLWSWLTSAVTPCPWTCRYVCGALFLQAAWLCLWRHVGLCNSITGWDGGDIVVSLLTEQGLELGGL